jgi:hypothetical protein
MQMEAPFEAGNEWNQSVTVQMNGPSGGENDPPEVLTAFPGL